MKRRDFLKTAAAVSMSAGVAGSWAGCVRREEEVFFEQVVGRENDRSGVSRWEQGICGQCNAGCGVRVRVVDGDVKKIEGVPEHPLSRGGLCALGQSAPQELYDPDRLFEPLLRSDGEAALEPSTWEDALARVAGALAPSAARLAILSSSTDRFETRLCSALARDSGGSHFVWEPVDRAAERAAAREVFGWEGAATYDLENADMVVSFGAPLLDRWRSPVQAASLLRGRPDRERPTLVVVEPRMGLTAAAADLWIAPRVGTEGVLARALREELQRADAATDAASTESTSEEEADGSAEAPPSALVLAAEQCDVPLAKLQRMLDLLREAARPVAVGGGAWVSAEGAEGSQGTQSVVQVLRLNQSLGNVGRTGGVFPPAASPLQVGFDPGGPEALPSPGSFEALLGRLRAKDLTVLVVVECDALLRGPDAEEVVAALKDSVDEIVVLTSVRSDWLEFADVVLPIHTALERWSLQTAEAMTPRACLLAQRPAVRPIGSSLHPADVLLSLGKAALGDGAASPWTADGASSLFEEAAELSAQAMGSRMRELVDQGFLLATSAAPTEEPESTPASRAGFADRRGVDSEDLGESVVSNAADAVARDEGGFVLLPFETTHIADGRGANRAWLQQLPDPLSTVMWGSWAEFATADLRRLGWHTGDWVQLTGEREGASLVLPVVENPAARPGTVAVPLGYGQTDGGRYSRGRGVNVSILGARSVPGLARSSAVGLRVEAVAHQAAADQVFALFGRGLRHPEDLPKRRGRKLKKHTGNEETVGLGSAKKRPRVRPETDTEGSESEEDP